jgi:hypothetical protein
MYVCDYTYKSKAHILLFDSVPEECASKAYISKHQQDSTSLEGTLCRMMVLNGKASAKILVSKVQLKCISNVLQC